MSNACYRVPYTAVEWNRVRTLFQSADIDELKECLAILSMWRSRMGNSTPVAISCSEMLVRLAIAELQIDDDHNLWMKMEELKMQHCIVIIRFVNYVNEICQRQRQTSIVRAVQQLGIPSWLVEIRHNASHSHVPPIETLRMAFAFCREWIWEHFWTHQPYEAMRSAGAVDTNSDVVAEEASLRDQKILNAIVAFALWRNKNPSETTGKEAPVVELTRLVMQQPFDFLRIFVGDGCLIMTEGQLQCAGYSVSENWKVPLALQIYWKPVIIMVYEAKVVNELIINLLSRFSFDDNSTHAECQLVAWTKFFLEPCIETDTDLIPPSDWSRILHKLVAATGFFDAPLVEAVMAKVPNLSDKRRRQVRRIMDISLSESLCAVDDSMSVRTLEDLQRLIRKDRGTALTTAEPPTDGFVLCDSEEWCSIPLGFLPGGLVDTFSIIIDDDWILAQSRRKDRELSVIEEDE
uniref:LAS1-like protein n=2 Tax=Haemonchus contortus TaxID=6289 RepID=A0A7I4XTT2_HAECO